MLDGLRFKLLDALGGKPKTKIAAGGSDKDSLFDDHRARTPEHLKKCEIVYLQGGIVGEAVDCYPLFALSNGWRLEGEEAQVKQIQDFIDGLNKPDEDAGAVNLDSIIWQGIVDCIVYGDAFQELIANRGGEIVDVLPRLSSTFSIIYDDSGVVTGYQQKIGDTAAIPLKPDTVIHLCLNPMGGSLYGQSIIGRAYDDIIRDAETAESTKVAIKRHAYRKYHVQVGQPGELLDQSIINDVRSEFQKIESKNDFVTNRDVEINGLDVGGLGGVKEYSDWTITRLCAAMGVPEEILGLGRGSTEATANVRMKSFYDKIGTIQRIVARTYEIAIFDRITGVKGSVKLVFNDLDPQDEAAKAEWISGIMKTTPLDPFAVLPREWIQKQFDIDPEAYVTEEDDLPPMIDEEEELEEEVPIPE